MQYMKPKNFSQCGRVPPGRKAPTKISQVSNKSEKIYDCASIFGPTSAENSKMQVSPEKAAGGVELNIRSSSSSPATAAAATSPVFHNTNATVPGPVPRIHCGPPVTGAGPVPQPVPGSGPAKTSVPTARGLREIQLHKNNHNSHRIHNFGSVFAGIIPS